MKIIVTGIAGFIGYHLSEKLIGLGHEVIGIDNLNSYYDVQLKLTRLRNLGFNDIFENDDDTPNISKSKKVLFYKADLSDTNAIRSIFETNNPDIVINLAAQAGVRYSLTNPSAYINSNVMGFLNILEGCRDKQVKHLIYASTSSVYGLNTKMPLSTDDPCDHPITIYAATKKSNELMAHTYSHLFNIPTTGLRFFTVYGPWGRPDMALFLFTKSILNDEPVNVFNNGDMVRDFTYVEDIAESISRLIHKPPTSNPDWDSTNPNPSTSSAPYRLFNIGNSSPVKLMDYISEIEKSLGKKAKINFMEMQQGDVPKTHADTRALQDYIDFKPSTPISKGISKFIDWYLTYYQ